MKPCQPILLAIIVLIPALLVVGFILNLITNEFILYLSFAITILSFIFFLGRSFNILSKKQKSLKLQAKKNIEDENSELILEVKNCKFNNEFYEQQIIQQDKYIAELKIGLASKLSTQERSIALATLGELKGEPNLNRLAIELEKSWDLSGITELVPADSPQK